MAQETSLITAPGLPSVAYREAVAILSLPADAEAETFAEALRDALVREFAAAGFREILHLGPAPAADLQDPADQADQVLASVASSQASARWTALVRCSVERRRLLWTVTVYDALDGALIAADAQASFAGLSALPFIDNSASLVARQAWELRARVIPGQPIGYRIRFISANDGARVASARVHLRAMPVRSRTACCRHPSLPSGTATLWWYPWTRMATGAGP